MQQFIQKLIISEPIVFSVSDETKFNSVDFNSWKVDYTVLKTKMGITKTTKVVQKVFFHETPKSFGANSKVVFSTFLGEM